MIHLTKTEIEDCKKRAYRLAMSFDSLYMGKKPRLDMRYKKSKVTLSFFYEIMQNIDVENIIYKKKKRLNNKPKPFANYLNNRLYLDYKKNTPTGVYQDRLYFNGRNHWAKNAEDFKVLSILRKHFLSHKNKNNQ